MFILVLDSNNVRAEYHQEHNILKVTWQGYFSSEFYRSANEKILDFATTHPVAGMVIDTVECGIVKNEDTDWASNVIVPKWLNLGLRYIGYVLPKSVFTKISIQRIAEQVNDDSNLVQQYFSTVPDAEQWLNQVLQPA